MTYFRLVVALALLVFCLWLSALNWIVMARGFLGKAAPSWLPLLPGLLGAAGSQIFPLQDIQKLWWLAFVIDAGSLPGFTVTIIWHILRTRKGRERPR